MTTRKRTINDKIESKARKYGSVLALITALFVAFGYVSGGIGKLIDVFKTPEKVEKLETKERIQDSLNKGIEWRKKSNARKFQEHDSLFQLLKDGKKLN